MDKWMIGIIGSVVGFLASQFLVYYTFQVNLETTKQLEMVRLAKDLTKEFYSGDPDYRKVRVAMESCKKLYKGWGGEFDHDQINRFLGFFEDLGFYYKEGILDYKIINHLFGAYIIEAYEYNEFRKYIDELRKNMKQPTAFVEFQALASRLEQIPERKDMIEVARRGCIEAREKEKPAKRSGGHSESPGGQ